MDSRSSKLSQAPKRRIALVQGELFRCVAVESELGRWTKVDDGAELPRVLEVLQVLGERNAEGIRKPRW